ncbi:CYTH and CHAD domain-containing protein [Pigmentiphaga soli]|uniref:CYTH and CHAD domain-containing protein n=1 Tax=Pigmentiphaga soli TaxID=1007095 RepID=A0ABP8HT15_9BURK
MLEQEIKLFVPPAARKAVAAQLASLAASRRVRLRAMYFDTADRQLASRRAAIRLRQEGRKWVQTFKMEGGDAVSRIELNHPVSAPQLDLSVYAGTPAAPLLERLEGPLEARYETDVMRASCRVRTRGGTAEIAYDVGAIRAGGLELPVHELEFELQSGRVDGLFALAGRWLRAHGLVLDVRSKAERGDALAGAAARIAAAAEGGQAAARSAEIARFWAPVQAGKTGLRPHMTPAEALTAISADCVDQIIRNAAALAEAADACGDGGEEHVHQLRVGIRRLRSAWRLFKEWTPLPDERLRQAASAHFAAFGALRDSDVLGGTLVPALQAAGMPPIAPAAAAEDAPDAATLAASPAFQGWLLDMQAWNVGCRPPPARTAAARPAKADPETAAVAARGALTIFGPGGEAASAVAAGAPASAGAAGSAEPAPAPKLADLAAGRMRKWHRRLAAQGKNFHALADEQRHDLRKLAKRLRYALSFTEPLYRRSAVRPYRKQLAALQDILGDINDLVVAREHYAALTEGHPQAWFALGWISGRLEALHAKAEAGFAALKAAKPFWR